jgi:hypothetical protein
MSVQTRLLSTARDARYAIGSTTPGGSAATWMIATHFDVLLVD